jgi:hypothetical protein
MTTFTVDTHLFRELGELLVGRDSTALIELIKNAYDADATDVIVYGEALDNASRGYIKIQDNGIGMSEEEFKNGFLRIASRGKDTSNRRSSAFNRRYTGAKGIGRLAAHKLAKFLRIESARWNASAAKSENSRGRLPAYPVGLEATIDWDLIESKTTLDELSETNAIVIGNTELGKTAFAGTTITLSRLRRPWSQLQHGRFLEEIQTFEPPNALTAPLSKAVTLQPLIFEEPLVRDVRRAGGSRFSVRLDGDLTPPDDYWTAVLGAANWIIEIDANRHDHCVHYAIAPTQATNAHLPYAVRRFKTAHPSSSGPFFQARIIKRTGARRGELKKWTDRASGVRVYMEGFRVLPYGESRKLAALGLGRC